MKTILTGVQPSGQLHIGNYFGAIKPFLEMQNNFKCYLFIANLHSLTTTTNKDLMLNVILDYLALGVDPEHTVLFVQSEIPQVTKLAWIFACLTNPGVLNRAHSWKDAQQNKNKKATVGLYTYPILMAADILLYSPDLIPVGQDQKQHIEITRDIALKFNDHYKTNFFNPPEAYIKKEQATIPGIDGRKMSKSYKNTIPIFQTEQDAKKTVMSIKTDSRSIEEPKNPDECNVFQIYSHFATKDELETLKDKYLAGGLGYGEAKKILLQKYNEYFKEANEKRVALSQNLNYVKDIINIGNKQAQKKASETMNKIEDLIGLKIF